MSNKAHIQAEIQTLDREELEELCAWILQFLESKRQAQPAGVLTRLAMIQIEGPEDFSVNHDLYITGEKSALPNSD